jgi:hypothetical protein
VYFVRELEDSTCNVVPIVCGYKLSTHDHLIVAQQSDSSCALFMKREKISEMVERFPLLGHGQV